MATLTLDQIGMYAAAAGLPSPATFAAIGMAESSGSTTVVNSIGCVGIWQINQPVWVKSHPTWTVAWLQNPANNAAAAKVIYDAQGFGAWETYTNGAYQKYLSAATAADADSHWYDPFGILPGDGTDIPSPSGAIDALGTVDDAVKKTADVLVNPRTWLRVGYGTIGVFLIVGGLFLMVSNSKVGKGVEKVASNVKVIPV